MNTEPVKTEDGYDRIRWQPQRAGERLYYSNPNGQGCSYFWQAPGSEVYGHPSVYISKRHAVRIAEHGTFGERIDEHWKGMLGAYVGVSAALVVASGFLFGW